MQIRIIRDEGADTYTLIIDSAKETIRVPGLNEDLLEQLEGEVERALRQTDTARMRNARHGAL